MQVINFVLQIYYILKLMIVLKLKEISKHLKQNANITE